MATETNIESTLSERRLFAPPPEFTRHAAIKTMAEYEALYKESLDSPDTFWPRMASELHWFKKWDKLLDWSNPPFAKWFVGGKMNISYNCLDRHLHTHRKNKAAIIFEGEPGDRQVITYAQLHREVCKFANVLKAQGVQSGDRVAIYMPMIPEAAVAMLACMRIGAGHTIVFGGFSAEALADRINDAQASLVITADGGWRRGKAIDLKKNVDAALAKTTSVRKCIVVKRTGQPIDFHPKRDLWYHEQMDSAPADCPAEELDSEHLCFILYTSGTTGKPKGVMHTTAGYLLGAYLTCKYVFDLKDSDVYWCTADIGWVTGHSYVVYGPLANGATTLMYEGAPNWPHEDRFWQIIENYGVNVFYTAPTAIRAFIKWGDEHPNNHDLSSLRLLGTVGEPINPEAWMWYREVIGGDRCPIVDTWWQTETGAIMCTPLPGVTPTKPGSCTRPFFGVDAAVVDKQGHEVPANAGGYFVIRKPWPSMLRTVWGDDERFKKTYFGEIPDTAGNIGAIYFTGDGARKDQDGYFWVMGRVDDVVNVAGHRLGTMEVESALVAHEKVAEAAVVGRPDDFKGQALCAFVTVISGIAPDDKLKEELKNWVGKEIGSIAKPDDIRFTDALPKTRSGKIMRRLLRDIAAGKESIGDTTTLEDYTILAKLRESDE
ncbi:MAG TPA: acetate--CoA ligase [Phycisphaerae bacterium]|nr:acetate--CoA ligase [Phycisphaerae bacterium]